MKDILDFHTHTIASGHAYNTMNEMIAAAKLRGLEIYGITEHAPRMNGSCTEMYFQNFRILPREKDGMTVLHGVELNILDGRGSCGFNRESACRRWTLELQVCICRAIQAEGLWKIQKPI